MIKTKKYDKDLTPENYFEVDDVKLEKMTLKVENYLQSKKRKPKQISHRFFRGPDDARTTEIFRIVDSKSQPGLSSMRVFSDLTESFMKKAYSSENISKSEEIDTKSINSPK
jgi:hypothetical protein